MVISSKSYVQETSIELVIIGDDGIVQSVSEQPVFGTIKDLAVLPWTDRFHPSNPPVCRFLSIVWVSSLELENKLIFMFF